MWGKNKNNCQVAIETITLYLKYIGISQDITKGVIEMSMQVKTVGQTINTKYCLHS